MTIINQGNEVYTGLSTDTKPTTGIPAGSRFIETNTGITYVWNGTSWIAEDTTTVAQTLTNKTADGELNTFANIVGPSSYIGYKAGSNIKIRNTQTGVIDFSGTDATTVFNNCLAAIRNTGRRLSLLGNTTFSLTGTLNMDLYQSLSGESQFGLARLFATGDFPAITIKQTVSGACQRLEIANLYLTHNQTTYSDGLVSLQTTSGNLIAIADIHHCYFYDFGQNKGNAIRFNNSSAPIYKVNVYNCEMYGFQDQLYANFVAGDANSWMTNNTFVSINHWFPNNTTLTVNSPSGALFSGHWINCFTQSGANNNGYDFSTSHAGNSWYTYFTNCLVWDLVAGKDAWKFNGTSEVTMLGCQPDYKISGLGATNGKVIKNSTYSRRYGFSQFNGTGSATTFSVSTGLPTAGGSITPATLKSVRVTPASANATGNYYITTTDASAFVVNYTVAPPSGTNNVQFYWEAQS